MNHLKNIVRAFVRKDVGYIYQDEDIRLSVKRCEYDGMYSNAYFLHYQRGTDEGTNLFMNADEGMYVWHYYIDAVSKQIICNVMKELGMQATSEEFGLWVKLIPIRQTSSIVTIDSLWGEL